MRASYINLLILYILLTPAGYSMGFTGIDAAFLNSGSPADSSRSEYLDELAAINKMGIQLALLARGRPVRQEVKMLANKSLQYHRKIGQELRQLAQSKRLAYQEKMLDDDKDAIGKLFRLKGALFERTFLNLASENQRKLLVLYKKAAEKTDDQELMKFVTTVSPELEAHNAAVKMLRTTIK
ncbi:DUF4142 domain-containing protein [Desertivirga brevis]|uniref:DUF4142 domain-containing protein n=1 Tax=Desertivirga brevis TaxID=2810310 RepID=UPI001A974DC5|nr:DUF4142 domain-containing protein [Pedobacter sp. SYSU D00873]